VIILWSISLSDSNHFTFPFIILVILLYIPSLFGDVSIHHSVSIWIFVSSFHQNRDIFSCNSFLFTSYSHFSLVEVIKRVSQERSFPMTLA
jgi:hypothetical protein